jgi:hypothetical protein
MTITTSCEETTVKKLEQQRLKQKLKHKEYSAILDREK